MTKYCGTTLLVGVHVFIVFFTALLTAHEAKAAENDYIDRIWNIVWSGNAKDELNEWKSFYTPKASNSKNFLAWKYLHTEGVSKFFTGSNGKVKINQKNWNTSEWIGPDFFQSLMNVKMCFKDYPAFEINNQILIPSKAESYTVKKGGKSVTLISENNENLKTAFNLNKNTGKLEFDPPGSNNNNKCTDKQEIYKSNASAVVLFLGGKRQVSVTKNNGFVFNVTYENKDGNTEFDIKVYNWSMNFALPAKFISYKNGTDKNANKFLLMTQEKQNHIILGLPLCENNTINNCFFENETISDIDSAIEIINKNNAELKKATAEEKNDNQNGIPEKKGDSTHKEDADFTETEMDQKKISDTPIETESTSETKKDQNNTADKHVDDSPESPSDVVVNDNDSNDKNNPVVDTENGGVSGLLIFIYTAIALLITAAFVVGALWLLKRHQQRNALPSVTNLFASKRT